jgi:NTE family protein
VHALVISGGGSKGAYAGGIAEYLICEARKEYDIFVGTSTGSLLVPFLASGEIHVAKSVFSNVRQTDIFSSCPFIVKKTPTGFKTKINHLSVLMQYIRGRNTFGESLSLKKLIRRTLTKDIFDKIANGHPYVVVTVANLSRNVVEYKYARDCSYDEFCDWVWVSSNMVPFMSLVQKNGDDYADGGFGNLVPIQEAINMGAKEIDVIILNPRHITSCYPQSTNSFNLLVRGFGFMLHQIGQDDIKMGLLESRYSDLRINLIHTPRELTDNSFIFNPEQMSAWWNEGFAYAREIYDKTAPTL